MKIKYILVSIILIITCTILHAQSISINSTFTEYSTYDLSDISTISNLASVSIDGSVQWIDKDRIGIARVVLVDEKLEEYFNERWRPFTSDNKGV